MTRCTRPCLLAVIIATSIPTLPHAALAREEGAPGLLILAAGQAGPVRAGDLAIETPWLRATPNGATVAGGYVRITNTGSQPDRLTGAAIPAAEKSSVHTMSMDNGVMKMAPLDGGLPIKPGETVELKPGGLHLMFEALKASLKAGDVVKGSLTFERAGTVPVTFTVAPIGAQGPGGAAGGHQHH
ncbi:copper chaperone PCu(A)C [Methylobacterium sp. A54F]